MSDKATPEQVLEFLRHYEKYATYVHSRVMFRRAAELVKDGEANKRLLAVANGGAPELDGSFPMVLYFDSAAGRDEFVALYKQVHPNAETRNL